MLASLRHVLQAVCIFLAWMFWVACQPEPLPPAHAHALCCHRVAAVRGDAGDISFVELPHRHMEWSPVAVRGEAGVLAWRLSWACPRCSRVLDWAEAEVPYDAGTPCPDCRRLRGWEFDAAARICAAHADGNPARSPGHLRSPTAPMLLPIIWCPCAGAGLGRFGA